MSLFKNILKRKINKTIEKTINVSPNEIDTLLSVVSLINDATDNNQEIKSVSGATTIYLNQIKRDFPDYHFPDVKFAVNNFIIEFLSIQYGVKKCFSNSNVHPSIINIIPKSISEHKINNIIINNVSICDYDKSDEYATVKLQCSVGFNVDNKRIETRYKIDHTLRLTENNVATKTLICQNCGATIENTSITRCEYCNTKIIRDTILTWKFTSIKEE